MKKTFIHVVCVIATLLSSLSCGPKSETAGTDKLADTELSGFMLGGIYFINGWGGEEEVSNLVQQNAGDDKEEIIKQYRELFIFPFKPEEGEGAKSMLSSAWEINSKADLEKSLKELQNDPTAKHKAWNYARLVNNVCMGYSAGYLTKEEGTKYVNETLPLAKVAYKTWEEYYADYNAGRKAWSESDGDGETFEALSKTIVKGENSVYTILPLN